MTKDKDLVKPRGVALKTSEWQEIDDLADKLEWKPGAVTAYAIRYFLKHYQAGKIKIVEKTTKELPDL